MTKDDIMAKIAALDEQMKVLNEKYVVALDDETKSGIAKEVYSVARQTNRLLRIIGAEESEMYAID